MGLVLLSAVLTALAFPPWNLWPFAWVALVPFLLALRDAPPRRAFWLGLVWGTAEHWATAYWVIPAMAYYYQQPWWFAFLFGVFSSLAYRGLFYGVLGFVLAAGGRRLGSTTRVLFTAALWVAVELVRMRGPTADPWLLIGYTLLPYSTLIQVADVAGIHALSFLVVFVNAAIAQLLCEISEHARNLPRTPSFGDSRFSRRLRFPPLKKGGQGGFLLRIKRRNPPQSPFFKGGSHSAERRRQKIDSPFARGGHGEAPPTYEGGGRREVLDRHRQVRAVPAVLAALVLLVGSWLYGARNLAAELPTEPTVPLAIIQGNNDYGAQWSPEFYGKGLDEYLKLSLQRSTRPSPALLVWPESAVTFFLAHEPHQERRIRRLLRATGADLIVGAPHYEGSDPAIPEFLNSAFYITPQDGIVDRYDKVTLLPFAEYFPLRFSQFLRRNFARVRSFTPGTDTKPLQTRFGPMAVAICFEAAHPNEVRKRMAENAIALVNLSNDGWLGRGAGPLQHFAMARLRAIENRAWLIRSTTTGISAVVDPFGRVIAQLPLFEPGSIAASFVPLRGETPYERWGDWYGLTCLILVIVIAVRRNPSTSR